MNKAPEARSSEADVFYGQHAIGRTHLINHNNGQRLTRGQALQAKCYECMCGYVDGRVDCKIPDCPLYQYMPYKDK